MHYYNGVFTIWKLQSSLCGMSPSFSKQHVHQEERTPHPSQKNPQNQTPTMTVNNYYVTAHLLRTDSFCKLNY